MEWLGYLYERERAAGRLWMGFMEDTVEWRGLLEAFKPVHCALLGVIVWLVGNWALMLDLTASDIVRVSYYLRIRQRGMLRVRSYRLQVLT
jgi:hypothetical protein